MNNTLLEASFVLPYDVKQTSIPMADLEGQ
jgi:hypothetical protein